MSYKVTVSEVVKNVPKSFNIRREERIGRMEI